MLEKIYESIIGDLKLEKRPRILLTPEIEQELIKNLENSLNLEQTLCIICHLSRPNTSIGQNLIHLLEKNISINDQIYTLEGIQHHIMDARMISGDRLSPDFLHRFNQYLQNCSKKVLPFTLTIIENSGSQGIYFKPALEKIKWGFFDVFNKQNREVISRIDFLINRWQKFTK